MCIRSAYSDYGQCPATSFTPGKGSVLDLPLSSHPEIDLCLGQRMMMFRVLPDMAPEYLMWALNSEPINQQVILYTGGATSPHINIGDIVNFHVPSPPLAEQLEIADRINSVCAGLDKLAERLNFGIERIQEYRSALIANAVTGKIDVCNPVQKEAAE